MTGCRTCSNYTPNELCASCEERSEHEAGRGGQPTPIVPRVTDAAREAFEWQRLPEGVSSEW